MSELLGIFGKNNRSSQQWKFETYGEARNGSQICAAMCCFFQSKAKTSRLNIQMRQTTLFILQSSSSL